MCAAKARNKSKHRPHPRPAPATPREPEVETPAYSLLEHPRTGNVLAVCAGLAFMFVCTVLPLVGQAGAEVPYSSRNFTAFLIVLLVALALSVVAVGSKVLRRRRDGSPHPWLSYLLLGVHVDLLLALLLGLLKI